MRYEPKAPRCDTCKIFGHTIDHCPLNVGSATNVNTSNVVNPPMESVNDGFQKVTKKKKNKGKSKSAAGYKMVGPTMRYEPKAPKNDLKKIPPLSAASGSAHQNNTSNVDSVGKSSSDVQNMSQVTSPNSFSALAHEVDDEVVDNIYDESANILNPDDSTGGEILEVGLVVSLISGDELVVIGAVIVIVVAILEVWKQVAKDSQSRGHRQTPLEIRILTESSREKPDLAISLLAVQRTSNSKASVKIKELHNPEVVEGAAVVIPLEAVNDVSARFENTLFGYFIGNRLAFSLVENYVNNTWAKYGLKRIQLHEEFFMFQFNAKEGMENVMANGPWLIRGVPLILNIWTPNTDLKKDVIKKAPLWVRMHHVPIVAYSEVGLSLITTQLGMPIMLDSYTSNMCVSSWGRNSYARALIEFSADVELKKSIVIAIPLANGKGHSLATIDIEYEWLPPRCEFCKVFDHVNDKCPKNPKVSPSVEVKDDGFTMVTKKNKRKKQQNKQVEGVRLSKPALNLQYRKVDKDVMAKKSDILNAKPAQQPLIPKPILKKPNEPVVSTKNSFGALNVEEELEKNISNIVISENNLSVFAILESHVVKSKLMKMCSLVFRHWDWTSNGAWCSKGTRIILGWNHNEVDVTIINQNDQAVHSRLWLKKEKKEIFCTFVYAHNKYNQRRDLWNALCLHKVFVNNRPWCLLGDFNATLHLSESTASSSCIDIAMREFKDCVNNIEVLDVQNTGLHFTWNQKPKHDRFKEVVNEAWNYHVSGFYMFRTVKKLKNLKKPLRKLMIDKANVVAFNQAVLDEEMFLKQKAKISWLKDGDSNTAYFHKLTDDFVAHTKLLLDKQVTLMIKEAMFSMGDEKSPGPDGFSAAFFKQAWHIVGVDVINAIREFFTNGKLLKELNHTIIALIPKEKGRLRQGDTLSPYFSHRLMGSSAYVQEVRFRIRIAFAFHRYCDKLELINFALRVDFDLLRMGCSIELWLSWQCLDEFKHASGLIPSIPKSTAFFCNVLNHVKLSILNVLPFEEGRLQLIRSVISSMHVFWASVFVIPNRVLMDIEQSMRNFLWCPSSSSKGKAKVAWELVCLPKMIGLRSVVVEVGVHAYMLKRCGNSLDFHIRGNYVLELAENFAVRTSIQEFIGER
ncbi:hypothetical protein Tco_0705266 [Tanacetum coccineum]|uniref:DUF4283 domain-containing protein n=1 Tax=Tanacetum coccineum TaxID=301880 RepID=A0ABQ4Y4Y9_9ASTR